MWQCDGTVITHHFQVNSWLQDCNLVACAACINAWMCVCVHVDKALTRLQTMPFSACQAMLPLLIAVKLYLLRSQLRRPQFHRAFMSCFST